MTITFGNLLNGIESLKSETSCYRSRKGISMFQLRLTAGLLPTSGWKRFIEDNKNEVIDVQFLNPIIILEDGKIDDCCVCCFYVKNKRFEYEVPFTSFDVIERLTTHYV